MATTKLVGIEDPDFKLDLYQTYAESVLQRQKINRQISDSQDEDLERNFVKNKSDELIRYIEEYAIPISLTINSRTSFANVNWEISGDTQRLFVYENMRDYVLQTPYATYNMMKPVGERVIEKFNGVPGVKAELEIFTYRNTQESKLRISITFSIASIK